MHKRILVIQNPGKISRFYLEGIIHALERMGHDPLVFEISTLDQIAESDLPEFTTHFAQEIQRAGITGVASYACHGAFCFARVGDGKGSLFNALNIPHYMIWTDHPQWFGDRIALSDEVQERLRHPGNHHFLKSASAANELHEILGWPNCHMLRMAEDADILKPVHPLPEPEFDIVTIAGGLPKFPEDLRPYLEQDDPDYMEMKRLVAKALPDRLAQRVRSIVPKTVQQSEINDWSRQWVDLCVAEDVDPFRHDAQLQESYPKITDALRLDHHAYFDCTSYLWCLWNWQRPFYLEYLRRYFSIGLFGGQNGDAPEWVEYQEQPMIYAKGRVVLSIPQGPDIEGLTHKPFQIAASGVPMAHMSRIGLDDCFTAGIECETFVKPREARETIGRMLSDPSHAKSLATNARNRLVREHSWDERLRQMFAVSGE